MDDAATGTPVELIFEGCDESGFSVAASGVLECRVVGEEAIHRTDGSVLEYVTAAAPAHEGLDVVEGAVTSELFDRDTVPAVVETRRETYPGTEFRSRTERERGRFPSAGPESAARLLDRLTTRPRDAVRGGSLAGPVAAPQASAPRPWASRNRPSVSTCTAASRYSSEASSKRRTGPSNDHVASRDRGRRGARRTQTVSQR